MKVLRRALPPKTEDSRLGTGFAWNSPLEQGKTMIQAARTHSHPLIRPDGKEKGILS